MNRYAWNTAPFMTTQECVESFGKIMEAKLAQNRHKGDREGWLRCSQEQLFARLKEEVLELQAELLNGNCYGIEQECADVANFAMMIADKAGLAIVRREQGV